MFRLAAVADELTVFDCVTSPSSPLLPTRTGVFVFDAPLCSASEIASASWSFFASWPIACVPPEPHAQSRPACAWPASCFVPFRLAAVAAEETSFDCVTLPPSPELWTRTRMFSFVAPFCSAAERAAAVWSDLASWPIACVPVPA